jgi:short-subunit dehydrogenase
MNYLITGATSGLGFEIYNILKKSEDSKFYIIFRNKKCIKKLAYKNTYLYCCDLNNLKKLTAVLDSISVDSNNKIDVLICNAAIGFKGIFTKTPKRKYLKLFHVNFLSHILIIKKILPIMLKKNFGHIINISSATALFGLNSYSAYSASKSMLHTVFESLYLENLKNNIKIKNFFPGLMSTNFNKKNFIFDKNYSNSSDPKLIAKVICDNLLTNKFNFFCQKKLFLALILKIFPKIFFYFNNFLYSSQEVRKK